MARLSERLGLPPLSLEERVCDLLAQRAKIEAVKLYRAETGVGLARAKTAVEVIGRARPTSPLT